MTDIKCFTFSETQAQAGLNNDGNFRNGGNFGKVRTDIKCHTFLEPQTQVDLIGNGWKCQ